MTSKLDLLRQITDRLLSLAPRRLGVVLEGESGEQAYARNWRGPVRGLWKGTLDQFEFYDMAMTVVTNGLTRAFRDGAKSMGVMPDEFTDRERAALDQAIRTEVSHIDSLLDRLLQDVKDGRKLNEMLARLEPWYLRYRDVQNQARVLVGADQKLKWVINPKKEHCRSCLALANKVKRASQWLAAGLSPQRPPNPKLE